MELISYDCMQRRTTYFQNPNYLKSNIQDLSLCKQLAKNPKEQAVTFLILTITYVVLICFEKKNLDIISAWIGIQNGNGHYNPKVWNMLHVAIRR